VQDKACEAFQGEAPSLCAAAALKVFFFFIILKPRVE